MSAQEEGVRLLLCCYVCFCVAYVCFCVVLCSPPKIISLDLGSTSTWSLLLVSVCPPRTSVSYALKSAPDPRFVKGMEDRIRALEQHATMLAVENNKLRVRMGLPEIPHQLPGDIDGMPSPHSSGVHRNYVCERLKESLEERVLKVAV